VASGSEPLLTACVHPTVSADFAAVNEIVCEYGRALTTLFLERHAATLQQSCPGIIDFLGSWRDSEISFDSAWDASLGSLRTAMVSPSIDPVTCAARFAAYLCSNGVPGAWQARFPEPRRVKWGNLLLPSSREVKVSGGHDSFAVAVVDAAAQLLDLNLRRTPQGWQARHSQQLPNCILLGHDVRFLAEDGLDCIDLPQPDGELSRLPSDEILDMCRQTVGLMRCYAPSYLRWVDKVLRYVIPLKGGDNRLRSCSNSDLPGIVEISFPSRCISIAEMFVHEASHQYFHIARRLEAVHDGSDNRLFHSPVKGTGRPIDAILLAFHAFGNVVLFYRLCIEAGLDDNGYCTDNAARHLAELEIMRSHLQSSRALTEVGALLWRPLAAKLFPSAPNTRYDG
jgi:HEXXH motif-containing protein